MTSGGDAPGMNAAIRAVVRTALYHQVEVFGIMRGYQGMIQDDMQPMIATDVSNIIQRGGTILKTARSQEFMTYEGRKKAFENLSKNKIDALVLIGGDGTMRGADIFFEEYNIPSVGLPGTIDNDLFGTDFTIGFDTAVHTAVMAIDKIRDTAEAHDRVFIVEVMGRDAGYIALHCGISCGAEHVFLPGQKESIDEVIEAIKGDRRRKKLSNIIVVAEGDESGGAAGLMAVLKKHLPDIDPRITILGHIQRGGSPTPNDRILASRLGYAAVNALIQGRRQEMVGIVNNEIVFSPFTSCTKTTKPYPLDLLDLTVVLAK
jgi:6-phosphofructokinase (EC 2.7.1.11)